MTDRVSFMPPAGLGVAERRAMLVGRAVEMRELEDALRRRAQEAARTDDGRRGSRHRQDAPRARLPRAARASPGRRPRVFRGAAREGGPAYEVFARVLRARFGIVEGHGRRGRQGPGARPGRRGARGPQGRRRRRTSSGSCSTSSSRTRRSSRRSRATPSSSAPCAARSSRASSRPTPARAPSPLVLVFDDLQWAHDDSLELLAYLVENLRGAHPHGVHRAPRDAGAARRLAKPRRRAPHVIELPPLGDTDAAAVMHDLLAPCGERRGVEELIDAAVTLAGGNPALLEQMVRIYHDTGVLEVDRRLVEDERWDDPRRQARERASCRSRVEDAVQARIAALAPEERELLERAAAMGGVFWLGGLVAIRRQERGAARGVGGRRGRGDVVLSAQLLRELRRARLRAAPARQHLRGRRGVRLQAQPRARGPGAPHAPGAAAALPPRHRRVARVPRQRRQRARSTSRCSRVTARRPAPAALAAAAYVAGGRRRALPVREREGRGALRPGPRRSSLQDCDHVDEDLRLTALHHHGDVLQSLGRNDEALPAPSCEMLHARVAARPAEQGRRGALAHRAPLPGDGAPRAGQPAPDRGARASSGRGRTSAASRAPSTTSASSTGSRATIRWRSSTRCAASPCAAGSATAAASPCRSTTWVSSSRTRATTRRRSTRSSRRCSIRRDIGDLVGVEHHAQQPRHRGAGPSATTQGARAVPGGLRGGQGDGRPQPHRAHPDQPRRDPQPPRATPQKAIALLKQAEDIADELGDKLGLAEAVRGLGKAYLARREYTKARECTQRAVELFAETESKVQLGVALRSLGEVTAAGDGGRRRA